MPTLRVVLIAVLVVGAGCSSVKPASTSSPTGAPESTPTSTITQSPTATPTASASPIRTARGPDSGTEWTGTVTEVIDGDTVEAEFPDGQIDTLRLLGVDTPETTLSRVSPEEFEGIPDSTAGRDHLFNWGEQATAFARAELAGKTVQIEVDTAADRRGSFGRLLVYIYVDGENFNKRLLTEGYARLYESEFGLREEFEAAESTARSNRVGLWAFEQAATTTPTSMPRPDGGSEGSLVVENIHADAEGNDHDNLNDEYIVFRNNGDEALEMGGWTISDEADHTYTVPSGFSLEPGATVTLYTGSGSDTGSELYWGSDSAIWNNGGDTIFVRDKGGNIILEREY